MRSRLRLFVASSLAFVLMAWSLASAAEAQSSQTAPATTQSQLASIQIDNFGRVNERYYRGAQPEGDDYADLAALGVRTLINLTSDDAQPNERALVERAGMAYVHIPMMTRTNPTGEQLVDFLRIVNDPARQPVFVHCVGGRHRTGVMSAVYRMTTEGWTPEQAFKEMKSYKFGADFLHPEFKSFVFGYRSEAVPAAESRDEKAALPKSRS